MRDAPPQRSKPLYGAPGFLDARAALDAGDGALAAERFGRYAQARPADPFGHYGLAKSLDRLGRYAAAREEYLRALDTDYLGDAAPRLETRRSAAWRGKKG